MEFLLEPEFAVSVSVIIATFNRCQPLVTAVRSLLAGSREVPFEVIVVDNAGTDDTRAAVQRLADEGHPVRYVLELRSGVSFARNAGAHAARAPILAFMDDDQQPSPTWVATIARRFREFPGISFLAGPVRPLWRTEPPAWLSREIQGVLSIIERGEEPCPISPAHWMCVPGGNAAVRRHVLEAVGGWAPYRRSQDRELTVRLLLAGYEGLYAPDMVMYHDIDGGRLDRAYFRRWHEAEGRMRAGYQFEELFTADGHIRAPSNGGRRLWGVSLYLYRRLFNELTECLTAVAMRRTADAFIHELKLRYLWSYISTRVAQKTTAPPRLVVAP
jgi:glycosyltransferase involved in cell wall biosynthesis